MVKNRFIKFYPMGRGATPSTLPLLNFRNKVAAQILKVCQWVYAPKMALQLSQSKNFAQLREKPVKLSEDGIHHSPWP